MEFEGREVNFAGSVWVEGVDVFEVEEVWEEGVLVESHGLGVQGVDFKVEELENG